MPCGCNCDICKIEKLKDSRLLSKIATGCLLLNDCVHTLHMVVWLAFTPSKVILPRPHTPFMIEMIIQVSSLQNMMAVFMYKHAGLNL